jgi:hypothetical protein
MMNFTSKELLGWSGFLFQIFGMDSLLCRVCEHVRCASSVHSPVGDTHDLHFTAKEYRVSKLPDVE